MNIIARAAIFIYDGSPISPIFPAKAGKPSDDAGEYLSSVAEKLMNSDTSRTTYVAEGSAQEELLRQFTFKPFMEAASALIASMDESLQALEIVREGYDMVIFTFDRDNEPHLCVAQLPYRRAVVHQVENGEEGLSTMLLSHGTVLPLSSSKAYRLCGQPVYRRYPFAGYGCADQRGQPPAVWRMPVHDGPNPHDQGGRQGCHRGDCAGRAADAG